MKKIDAAANKGKASVLHEKIITELENRAEKRNSIIPFPEYNRISSWLLHIGKQEREKVLEELQELKLIEIIPYHGLKILTNQKEE